MYHLKGLRHVALQEDRASWGKQPKNHHNSGFQEWFLRSQSWELDPVHPAKILHVTQQLSQPLASIWKEATWNSTYRISERYKFSNSTSLPYQILDCTSLAIWLALWKTDGLYFKNQFQKYTEEKVSPQWLFFCVCSFPSAKKLYFSSPKNSNHSIFPLL